VERKGLPGSVGSRDFRALGGLLAWAIFHLLSRRNDILLLVGMNMQAVMTQLTFWPSMVSFLLFTVPLALILGVALRGPKSGGDGSKSTDPPYDVGADQPPGMPVAT